MRKIHSLLPAREPVINRRKRFIPVSTPVFDGNELKYLTRCIREGWISSLGKFVAEFEEKFSHYHDARYGISTSSGTSALHLALASLGIKKGDEVIIPTFTMVSTAYAASYQGATSVLVDAECDTLNIDPGKIEEKITKKTKSIIAVHIYGHPCDMDPIMKIARKHKLLVIEDAAEAHGAEYKGRMVGSIGDIGCFSFYGNKIITTGEGGMLVTNSKKIKERAEYLRDMSFSKERHFWHRELGFNYRMSNLQAAVGLAQLERIDTFVRIKRRNARLYTTLLKNVRGITLPQEKPYAKNVYWMYGIVIEDDFGISRDELRKRLAKQCIETRVFFIPIHLQPIYQKMCKGAYPVAEELCKKGLYLPSGLTLTRNDIVYIASAIRDASGCYASS